MQCTKPLTTIAALCLHSVGSLALFCLMLDCWDCSIFWWIFALTIVVPMVCETYVVVRFTLLEGTAGYRQRQRCKS